MTATFYDRLAPHYHLLYGDWDAAITRQGDALSDLLVAQGIAPGAPILDAACGIGTQSIGLARHGSADGFGYFAGRGGAAAR
jgi:hypothetical protein